MDPRLGFALFALLLTALAMAFVLPGLGRVSAVSVMSRTRFHVPALLLAALPCSALSLYALLGDYSALHPARQQFRDASLGGSTASLPDPAAFYRELERHLARQPDDARARVMKARLDMQADRYELAAGEFRIVLEGASKATRDAALWLEYAEAMGMAQGGTLSGKTQQLIEKALALAPDSPKALDLAGSAALERGDYRTAAMHWRQLLVQLPPADPRRRELSLAVERAEQRAIGLSVAAP